MNTILQNIIAILVGLFVGSMINIAIIMMSGSIISPPEGADNTTMEGLKATMHLFEAKHFLFPFLAHAIGTFVGACVAAFIAKTHKLKMALVIGALFLFGGISVAMQLPSPVWFTCIDLIFAYLPMGWLGRKLVTKVRPQNNTPLQNG